MVKPQGSEDHPAGLGVPIGLAEEPVFAGPDGVARWTRLARATGLPEAGPIERLGRGTRGTAYRAGGRVLKVTRDASEAVGAALVRDSPDARGHASRIDHVFRLKGQVTAYAVIQELLDPLDLQDARDAQWARLADLWPAWTRARQYVPLIPDHVRAFVRDSRGSGQLESEWPAFVRWLAELACYFDRIGLRYHDFWSKNLMRRGPAYVAIDFGYSASAADRDPAIQTLARRFIKLAGQIPGV